MKLTETDIYRINKVERRVFQSVTEVFIHDRPDLQVDFSPSSAYKGKTNIPLCKSIFRGCVFLIMKTRYNFSYSMLSAHSGFRTTSVMKVTRKFHHILLTDKLYQNCYNRSLSLLESHVL